MITKMFMLVVLMISLGLLYWRILSAKTILPTIRRLSFFDAIDEAVGRCAEMGKPFFTTTKGTLARDPRCALAGVNLIGYIAGKCAEAGAGFTATTHVPELIPLMQAAIDEGYTAAGVPEQAPPALYQGQRMAWIAASLGYINREQVAASLFVGSMGVESMQIYEASKRAGAIVFGGTERSSHFAFLPTACDYWIIGEEVFAVGAYLSKTPTDVGTLAGQDYMKYMAIATVIVGIVLKTVGIDILSLWSL